MWFMNEAVCSLAKQIASHWRVELNVRKVEIVPFGEGLNELDVHSPLISNTSISSCFSLFEDKIWPVPTSPETHA